MPLFTYQDIVMVSVSLSLSSLSRVPAGAYFAPLKAYLKAST